MRQYWKPGQPKPEESRSLERQTASNPSVTDNINSEKPQLSKSVMGMKVNITYFSLYT